MMASFTDKIFNDSFDDKILLINKNDPHREGHHTFSKHLKF